MLYTAIKKEGKQLFGDKVFLLIALVQPIILIIMFGSSFSGGDINHLKTIVIDQDNTRYSGYIVSAINQSEFFDVIGYNYPINESIARLKNSEIRSVIIIPKGFQDKVNNKQTGDISIYLDSSNFLTYKSLSSAKIAIVKNGLMNITSDILGDMENQKNNSQEKVASLKDIFKQIKNESESLDKEIDRIKAIYDSIDLTEINSLNADIKSSLNDQENSTTTAMDAMDQMITALSTLKTINATDEMKKQIILSQMATINSGLESSNNNIAHLRSEVNKATIPESTSINTDALQKKLDHLRNLTDQANNISKSINFNFDMLDKNFLSEPITIDETAVFGDIKYFDYLGPGVLSLIIFFICIMAPALNIITEKEENTLYRLSTTPASSITIFFGKFLQFITFGFFEMIYTLGIAILLYHLRISGSLIDVTLVLGLLACCSISIGLYISSRVKSMQQALIIIPLIVIPSFLISNSFFPPDIMANFMTYVSKITPMTYSNHALNAIMVKGYSITDPSIFIDIVALLAFTFVPLILFIRSYRRLKY